MEINFEDDYAKFLSKSGRGDNKTEVQIYLNDAAEKRDEKLDVLSWWKLHSVKFPILAQVAKHVLAMPISTFASESAFSTGGRIIDKFRSSLTPRTAEALICTQDWLRSTRADLQETSDDGLQLHELIENLEKLETGKSFSILLHIIVLYFWLISYLLIN